MSDFNDYDFDVERDDWDLEWDDAPLSDHVLELFDDDDDDEPLAWGEEDYRAFDLRR